MRSRIGLLLMVVPWVGCAAHGEPEAELVEHAAVVEEPVVEEPVVEEPVVEDAPQPSSTCIRPGPTTSLVHKPFTGALADVTGDGQPDVVTLAYVDGAKTGLVVLTGHDDGRFDEGAVQDVDGSGIVLGDLDGDDDIDAVILSARSRPAYRVALNEGDGVFSLGPRRRIPGRFGGELNGASLVDLDDDGDLDAVVPLWDSLRVLRNRGDGQFLPGQRLTVGRDPFSTAVADLDGDGVQDLVVTSGAGIERDRDAYHASGSSLWFYRGTRRGFEAKAESLSVSEASEVAVADLDGDGVMEIAITRAWGISVVRDPRFWSTSGRWPAASTPTGPWVSGSTEVRFSMGTDGPLLIADLGEGPRPITSSFMEGRLNIAQGPEADRTASVEAGRFVAGLFAGSVAADGTLPDLVVLNAGPPAHSIYGDAGGEPGSSIEVLFVDCPSR